VGRGRDRHHGLGGHGRRRPPPAAPMTEPNQDNNKDGADQPPQKPSGLRNPTAAVRGVGAAALAGEALVLLLAIQPLRVLGAHLPGAAIGVVLGLSALCLILAGLLRHRWAWPAGYAPQAALIVAGLIFHPSLAVLGVVFALVWLYVMYVRRRVIG